MNRNVLFVLFLLLLALQLFIAIYLPINNVVEYWERNSDPLSMHFYIFVFAAIAFYVLFGLWFWRTLSPTGRKLAMVAVIGWAMDLYLICGTTYPSILYSSEPYMVGAMLIIGPCLILLLDLLSCRLRKD